MSKKKKVEKIVSNTYLLEDIILKYYILERNIFKYKYICIGYKYVLSLRGSEV